MASFLLGYRMVADGAVWIIKQEDDLKNIMAHIQSYPLENAAFRVYEYSGKFNFDDRINPACLKNVTPIIDNSPKPQVDASFVTSSHLCVVDGMLVKNPDTWKEVKPVENLAAEAAAAICQNVEAAIQKKVAVSQGVHDVYVTYSTMNNREVSIITGASSASSSSSDLVTATTAESLGFNKAFFATLKLADIIDISAELGAAFVQAYESGVASGKKVSQGLHDRYAKYCVSINREASNITTAPTLVGDR